MRTFFYVLLLTGISFLFHSCSTVSTKDCTKNMHEFGINQGRMGSPKKLTDQIRYKCSSKVPNIDIEAYDTGFMQGWREFCLPNNAFDMGKKSDSYISFCPTESEQYFRNSYLLGKKHFELKDVENDLEDQMSELKSTINTDSEDFSEYNRLQLELDRVKKDIQAVEVEGKKNIFNFH